MLIAFGTTVDSMGIISVTIAYQYAESGFISILGYVIIFYAFLADVFLFHAHIEPIVAICALVIAATCLSITIYKMQNK